MNHQATPYLTFSGNAKEALGYYKVIFNGEVSGIQTFGEADFDTPKAMDDYIMHAQFQSGALFFMVSDSFSGPSLTIGNHISLALELENEEEIRSLYDRFTERSTPLMELQDTFWGAIYAKVKDPYGVIWDLNYTKEG